MRDTNVSTKTYIAPAWSLTKQYMINAKVARMVFSSGTKITASSKDCMIHVTSYGGSKTTLVIYTASGYKGDSIFLNYYDRCIGDAVYTLYNLSLIHI